MPSKAGEPTGSILGLFPKGANTKPKVGNIPPREFFEFEAGMSCALSKIPPASAAAPRRAGLRQLFSKAQEWKALAGETFPGCGERCSETKRPKMKAWASLPGRPSPGPEPRLREGEDVSAAMAGPCMRYRILWLSRFAFMQRGLDPLIDKHLRDWYRSFYRSFYMQSHRRCSSTGKRGGEQAAARRETKQSLKLLS